MTIVYRYKYTVLLYYYFTHVFISVDKYARTGGSWYTIIYATMHIII